MFLNILLKTTSSPWLIPVCLMVGAGYSVLLYYRSGFRFEKGFFTFPNLGMAFLRFLSVSLIAWFLLSPFISKLFEKLEKPVIIVALDDSKSIVLSKDSVYYRTVWSKDVSKMLKSLSKKYTVQTFRFGKTVERNDTLDFSMTRTNISDMLDNIAEQNFNRNIGAFVLASDGIYNEGSDPLPSTFQFRTVFYTIALGDTTVKRDVSIRDVDYNSVAYLGDNFTIRVKLSAKKLGKSQVDLVVMHNNKALAQKPITIDQDNFTATMDFTIEAKEKGLQRYTITTTRLNGEMNYTNNSRDIYIEVLESRKKILILAQSPHPDVFAIKRSIEKNDNYRVTSMLIQDFRQTDLTKSLAAYDVIFLDQLPGASYPMKDFFKTVDNLKIPLFIIVGNQTSLGLLNSYNLGINILSRGGSPGSALPELSPGFDYFTFSENLKSIVPEYPPLAVPFADFRLNRDNETAITQKIGKVSTNYPLLVFINNPDYRVAVLCGEGIYRWPLYEYSISREQSAFDELINKSVQYLTVRSDKRLFRLKNLKTFFYEDEPVTFQADVFNKSYRKLDHAKVRIRIQNESGKTYDYDFHESENDYRLNAGFLPPGNYFFSASTFIDNKEEKITGTFSVRPVDIEYLNTVADHRLLYSIARNNDGRMFYPNETKKLTDLLLNQKNIKPVSHMDQDIRDMINFRWIFFLLLFLLGTEWFFRKYYGEY